MFAKLRIIFIEQKKTRQDGKVDRLSAAKTRQAMSL
jgi:hypothetical protein